ncbi:hypothetical protein ACNKHX_00180 [Shigella flexneri]
MTVSDGILKRSADAYRRIRNTARFLLANLNGFDPATDMVAPADMVVVNRSAVGRAKADQSAMVGRRGSQLPRCDPEADAFCSHRDRQLLPRRLGPSVHRQADSLARRSCQTTLYHIAEAMVRWMAP